MTAAPGWYNAPDKQGLLRWWDGTAWTENYQPASAPAPEPDGAPVFPGGIVPPAQRASDRADNILDSIEGVLGNKRVQNTGAMAGGAALMADGAGLNPFRRNGGLGGGLMAVLVGVVFLFLSFPNHGLLWDAQKAGEIRIPGTVTAVDWRTSTDSQGRQSRTCAPIATYTYQDVQGTATGNMYSAPCGYTEGQAITVLAMPDNITATARISALENGSNMKLLLTGMAAVGGLAVLGGIFTVIRSIVFLLGGAALIGFGWKRRKQMEEAERTEQ